MHPRKNGLENFKVKIISKKDEESNKNSSKTNCKYRSKKPEIKNRRKPVMSFLIFIYSSEHEKRCNAKFKRCYR